jgi:hypothetical protein
VATLAHFCHRPLAYIVIPENLRQGGSEIDSATSAGQKTHREKTLWQAEICWGNSFRRGEIIAIVIAIELDFIGITIITITSTFITTITMASRCNISG